MAQKLDDHFMIGPATKTISGTGEPTIKQLLQNVVYNRYTLKNSEYESCLLAMQKGAVLAKNNGIIWKREADLAKKLKIAFKDWERVKKNRLSLTDAQNERRKKFDKLLATKFGGELVQVNIQNTNVVVAAAANIDDVVDFVDADDTDFDDADFDVFDYDTAQPSASGVASPLKRKRDAHVRADTKMKKTRSGKY